MHFSKHFYLGQVFLYRSEMKQRRKSREKISVNLWIDFQNFKDTFKNASLRKILYVKQFYDLLFLGVELSSAGNFLYPKKSLKSRFHGFAGLIFKSNIFDFIRALSSPDPFQI